MEERDTLLLLAESRAALVVAAGIHFALISETSAPGSGVQALAAVELVRLLERGVAWARSPLIVLAVAAVVGEVALNIVRLVLQQRVVHSIRESISGQMLGSYLRMPYQNHLERGVADLAKNSHSAIREVVTGGLTRILARVSATATAVALVAVVARPNFNVAMGASVAMGGLVGILVLQPRMRRAGRRSHAIERDVLATLHETLQGIREVRLAGADVPRLRTFVRRQRLGARNRRNIAVLKGIPRIGIEKTVVVGPAVLLVVGAGPDGDGSAVP
jgi:ABC-type bacteriocin/lantibiotic exporter with double-glycine peptidase domain